MQAKIWNYRAWVTDTDPDEIYAKALYLIEQSGFTVLDTMEHWFTPQGYTLVLLLAESHFAVHTFPEHGKSYIELSSCNEDMHNKFMTLVDKVYYTTVEN